jgi:phage tail-like protein
MADTRQDPVLGFNFTVSLVETGSASAAVQVTVGLPPKAGFSECSGLEVSLQPETYPEGGNNGILLKFPGRAMWSNIRLKRGIVTSDDLWRWHLDFIEGHGKRRDGVITLQDEQGNSVRSWRFRRGLPVRWVGPALNAQSSQIAVEEIEIAHEGIRQTGAGGGSVLDSLANSLR